MSVEQIQEQIQQLPANDLKRLTQWFSDFLSSRVSLPGLGGETDWQESDELLAELDRRLAEFEANPGIATPFEPDYFDRLKRQLASERAQKASAR